MTQNVVFVFDLDGVITDPKNTLVDMQAVRHICTLIEKGDFVAINTGRSYTWVRENLLRALEKLDAAGSFDRVFIACEKGGEGIVWTSGTFTPQPSRFALSAEAQALTRSVFERRKAELPTMFWDSTKQTMATIEKFPQADLDQFKREQAYLITQLQTACVGQDVRIDGTTIATDVESSAAGKHAGAALIYEWVKQHADAAEVSFVSFGDSKSDYEMARHFAQKGNASTFVFVGAKAETFTEDPNVILQRTTAEYAAGTREYFESSNKR